MTNPADLLLTNAEVHTLAAPDETAEAVAIRDGEIVRVDSAYEVDFLNGVATEVIDCEGRVVLPGFIDAHTHLESQGQYLVHADLSAAESLEDAVALLHEQADPAGDDAGETVGENTGETAGEDADRGRRWIRGYGYDESEWPERRYLTREDLDRVSEDRPVVAMRVDMHVASLNSVALETLRDEMPDDDVLTADGEPTGVVVEDATEAVWDAVDTGYGATRELVTAAMDHAVARGVTGVHEKVRHSHAPQVYRDLDADGELALRVRIDYWSDHLESVMELGLATNAGSEMVRVGAIKSFTDGSFGGRTAKLFEAYADLESKTESGAADGQAEEDLAADDPSRGDVAADGGSVEGDGDGDSDEEGRDDENDGRGQWVVEPEELREIAARADEAGFQLTVHAIGDEAIEETIATFESLENPGASRHRIEHAELAHDDQIERMAEAGIVASMQPNFLQWAQPGGLYDQRLGEDRRTQTNRFRTVLDSGAPLAFGSDCMPLDPLLGVHHAVNAPVAEQRLSVTEALRAYTHGAAYAGFDEDRLGTVEAGKLADLVVLEESPWDASDRIDEIGVAWTIVGGEVVYEGQ